MKTTDKYSVMLADDHILLRDALASLINSFDEFTICAVAGDGEELIAKVKGGCTPQVILLDLNMPKLDGYDTAFWLYKNLPAAKILILTMYDSEIALIRLLHVGVRGFLKKDIHPQELRVALLSVANNGYYYTHNTTGKLASLFIKNNNNSTTIDRALLSENEIQFLKYASTDMTYKEIAQIMGMSPRSVDGYRDVLFDKLDVKSRVGLAIYAVKNGIVTF